MATDFQKAINIIRDKSTNDKMLGDVFEKMCKIFFENDTIQKQQFSKVWHYKDWARDKKKYSKTDIGIDLVAQIRNSDRFCAIQCKCYSPDHSISKADLDSFISASSSDDFKRLVLVDTSNQDIGPNAKSVFKTLHKTYQRIQTYELEQSRIAWLTYIEENRVTLVPKKELRDHQIQAVRDVKKGFKENDRGKMIMACGTGKTLTSLKIAEELAGKGKLVLYMVPSLALMSQTVREWKNDCKNDFTAFSACSDIKVGKRKPTDDRIEISLTDLAFPATTNPKELAKQIKESDPEKMTVIFSTYQSIDVISKSQINHKVPKFELIICDEAHRTTGATLTGDDESSFVKIHSDKNIKGKRRLYMTATPKIYGEKAKKKAQEGEVALASMDDKETFGPMFFFRGFNWAVENNILSDYKVVILVIDEGKVSASLQRSFEEGSELKLDDATKIIGCYKALAKVGFEKDSEKNKKLIPIKRALAFSQSIAISQVFEKEFKNVVNEYILNNEVDKISEINLEVEVGHVDGTFNADKRNEKLNWLKENTEKNICRILTNVRCLAEGVDVPSLDAIMFLHPKKSQVDVVQSVGRVMRKAEGKNIGYVILPITVAPGVSPEKALNDSEKYSVVWQILNALRAHDERLDSTINKIQLGEDISDKIDILSLDEELKTLTTEIEDVGPNYKPKKEDEENVVGLNNENQEETIKEDSEQLAFEIGDLSKAIKAKIVEKCGTRDYWENWAIDIAKIAKTHISNLNSILVKKKSKESKMFEKFLEEIRDDLNPEITEADAIEMLAQHIITKPVFDTLFQGNEFTKDNAVSKALEKVLDLIYENHAERKNPTLQKFYQSVKRRAKDIITTTGRQTLVYELYDRFFKNAFPHMTQRLGIVYTPVEVVDFIIHSVNNLLKDEFNKSLNNKNIHILDPFTGTGSFIARLLQSGLIEKNNISYKYKNEIHANEIVLLAYYIAGINVESVYQDLVKENQYQSFNGIVLTDTFQLYEQERDMIANLLPDNSNKRTSQKKRKIKVIIGNPPYSTGQKLANDNAANISYPSLDAKIEQTYAKYSKATLKSGLYDSYIRAFRWASDRLGEDEGVVGFITGAGWIDRNFADGMRKTISDEFHSIYIINLRGDIRKDMLSKKKAGEGENIFGQGSMTGIAITFLVKKKNNNNSKNIFYYDIGNNKNKLTKINFLKNAKSIEYIKNNNLFKKITPNEDNDWINKGKKIFKTFKPIIDKSRESLFLKSGPAVSTNRDAWTYNYSKKELQKNVNTLINNYNSLINKKINLNKAYNFPSTEINWSRSLKKNFEMGKKIPVKDGKIIISLYRPFSKQYLYLSNFLTEEKGITNSFLNKDSDRIINLSGAGGRSSFSVLMTNRISCIDMIEKNQCFPLKIYTDEHIEEGLFENISSNKFYARDGIANEGLIYFKNKYKEKNISKYDIFYYIYGLLHSREYTEMFKNNLRKSLPYIPAVKSYEDFRSFSKSGLTLSELHVNYEKADKYEVLFKKGDHNKLNISDKKTFYRVNKIIFGGKSYDPDKTTIIYNKNITIQNIPLAAYEYLINDKSAIEWVMERQCIKIDKKSEIKNDANNYANETMKNPAYPLELLQRVITVSLKTMKIIKSLPKLKID